MQLAEVVRELDSLEVSVRLQPHLPTHRFQDDEAPLVGEHVESVRGLGKRNSFRVPMNLIDQIISCSNLITRMIIER